MEDTRALLATAVVAWAQKGAERSVFDTLPRSVMPLLVMAHAESYALGDGLAKAQQNITGWPSTQPSPVPSALTDKIAESERAFLEKFANDIQSGLYVDELGNLRVDALRARAELYAHRLYGTAQRGWLDAMPRTVMLYWIARDDTGTCFDCATLEANGPYTADTIPTWPGSGDTDCNVGCRCWIETADGLLSFQEIKH